MVNARRSSVSFSVFLAMPAAEDRPSSPQSRSSGTKLVERRLVRVWKRVTRTIARTRQHRASILPEDFVMLTAAAARRRSIMPL